MKSPYLREEIQRQDHETERVKSVSLENYERCSFCHSKIVFSHDLDMNFLEVVETGRCQGCGVSQSPKKYTLQ